MASHPSFPRIAILISGKGSNMHALTDAVRNGKLNAEITFVGSDKAEASGLHTAQGKGLDTALFSNWSTAEHRANTEKELLRKLKTTQTEWLILAGFMRILSPAFVKNMTGRIVNIHPSLLPSFPGAHAIEDAFNYGVKYTGVTVHLVDEQVDHGPILAQSVIPIEDGETLASLTAKIHQEEHCLYAATLKHLFSNKGGN